MELFFHKNIAIIFFGSIIPLSTFVSLGRYIPNYKTTLNPLTSNQPKEDNILLYKKASHFMQLQMLYIFKR